MRTGAPTVLVVDDEPTPRTMICRMLLALGYRVRIANDPREALRVLQQHRREIKLVLTDVATPDMDGGELAERARHLDPRVRVVLMSRGPRNGSCPELPYLEKPLTSVALQRVLVPLLSPHPTV